MNYTAIEKFELLVTRLSFSVARKLLSDSLGFSAQGIEPFKQKISDRLATDPSISVKIDDIWMDVVFGGNRQITIYKDVSNTKFNSLDSHFSTLAAGLTQSNHPYVTNYPFPVDESTLSSCNTDLIFCHYSTMPVVNGRTIKCAVFSNKAYFTKTEPLQRSQLSAAGLAQISQDAQLFCKRRVSTQCFHAVILDSQNNNVYIAIDISALPSAEGSLEFHKLRSYLLGQASVNLVQGENLFRAISSLYDESDGRIHSVSFVTEDGNTDSIKLPSLASGGCIKNDNYHAAGENAASTLAKFRIIKLWDIGDMTVAAELHGKRAMLLNNGRLEKVIIHNGTKLSEIIYVLDKVLTHI
ncbi:hypothetical protein GOU96_06155 [Vibrio sp. R-1]|uniref:hypothetical protein n=1 Tax=Vibrio TaxID=662 RepID=UPI000BA8F20B|nr:MULTISPECIES: hypothetical protein [Vibrio]MCX9456693.1 hypothetical protein [Vibrio cholerae]MEB3776159.1 hypothetical protein [Vibrio sp. R-1]PAR83076.1 hypothetical protein CGT85_08905 [Vibrio cholerae]QYO72109.1 hypothetical protein KTC41_14400 [Vibrio cholerae]